jgi:hypothetical protein
LINDNFLLGAKAKMNFILFESLVAIKVYEGNICHRTSFRTQSKKEISRGKNLFLIKMIYDYKNKTVPLEDFTRAVRCETSVLAVNI